MDRVANGHSKCLDKNTKKWELMIKKSENKLKILLLNYLFHVKHIFPSVLTETKTTEIIASNYMVILI